MVAVETSKPHELHDSGNADMSDLVELRKNPTIDDVDRVQPGHDGSFFTTGSKSWTETIPRTDHNLLFLNCYYGSTMLGPLQDWNFALRMYASLVFADTRPACVYWGADRIAFYNDKFGINCGGVHPYLMGRSFADAFPELVEHIEPIFQQVAASAQTIDVKDILLFPIRDGFAEEMYFVGQFIPLRGPSGLVEGFYNVCNDNTARVLHERRRHVVERVATIIPTQVNMTLSHIMEALLENPKDITMAMLYTYDEIADGSDSNLRLFDTIGVAAGHRCAPIDANLEIDQVGLLSYFRKAKTSQKLLVLSQTDGSLQATASMFDDISWSGYGEPARDIVIVPLVVNGTTLGFYVQGTNPRRAYDGETERSIIDLTRQMEAKWAASLSVEQAIQREKLLELRAVDSENRLRSLAKNAPLGMCQISPDETVMWANDQYYEITGHERSDPRLSAFRDQVAADEETAAAEAFQSLLKGTPRFEREIRLKRRWTPPALERGDTGESEATHAWILVISFPVMEDGKLKLLMGYVSDISHQKWAENHQARNAKRAIMAKKAQEDFIDITSHEMRNPLSAITQLAESISKSLDGNNLESTSTMRRIADENVDAANTILACAAHQKRVIDDVLILSRLESHMLTITPVVEQAQTIVCNTIKMLSAEAASSGVEIQAIRDHSFDALHVDYILIDRSRLAQILINLISNSIKFASTQPQRNISVVYGAQKSHPPRIKTIFGELHWTAHASTPSDNLPSLRADQDVLYLYICVQDTGLGMDPEEMNRLFKRFSQGTTKTHINYGGSGLGLYICKQLAEKQGGGIGAASVKGKGSVFAFYVETRAVEAPKGSSQWRSNDSSQMFHKDESRPDLPQRMSSEAGLPDPPEPSSNASPIISMQHAQQQHRRVLLVEDNLINQKVLAKQLRGKDFNVVVANHGQEALEILEKTGHWRKYGSAIEDNGRTDSSDMLDIEIILMDLEMPVMDGVQCSKEIRRREEKFRVRKHLPIIATTANVRQEQKDTAINAGMDCVLSKPFTTVELISKINEILR